MVAKCRATWQHTGNNHCLMPPPKPPAYSGCFLCANTTFVSSGYSSKYELSTTTWNSTFVVCGSTEVEPLLEKCPINPRLTRSDDDNHNDLGNHDEDANHRHLRFIVMNFAIIAYQYNCYVHHF